MGQELFSFFRLESKRLLWFIGITVAIILALQYLELPYGNVLLSLFSAGNTPTSGSSVIQGRDPPSVSEIVNNVTMFNQANSTSEHALEITDKNRMSGEKDTIPRTGFVLEPGSQPNKSLGFDKSNKNPMVDSIKKSGNASAAQQVEDLGPSNYNNTSGWNLSTSSAGEESITSRPEHKSENPEANSTLPSLEKEPTYLTPPLSPTMNVSPNFSTAVMSNYSNMSLLKKDNKTNSMKEESFRPSQNDGNIPGNDSAADSMPEENHDSHVSAPEVTSVSEMSKLLLQSHASYRSMVCN